MSPGSARSWRPRSPSSNEAGIRVSLFIAAEPPQIEAAVAVGAPVIEIHTGAWCDALAEGRDAAAQAEWRRIADGAALAKRLGLEVHAGHGLDFETAETIAALPEIVELNIGHFLIGEAVYCGLADAVQDHARRHGSRPRAGKAHDPRHRLRPHRRPPHRAH